MNVAGSTAADLMSILTNKKEKNNSEENPFAAILAQALDVANIPQPPTDEASSASTVNSAPVGGRTVVPFTSDDEWFYKIDPAWKEDLFRKMDADPDYLPKSVVEADKNVEHYKRTLVKEFADDLRRHGVTGVSVMPEYDPEVVTKAYALQPAFIDGKYVMRAGGVGVGRPLPAHIREHRMLPPEEYARFERKIAEASMHPWPDAVADLNLFAKVADVGDNADYGDAPEKYAINLIISNLASRNAAFKDAYDADPGSAVEEYQKELGAIMMHPHLIMHDESPPLHNNA